MPVAAQPVEAVRAEQDERERRAERDRRRQHATGQAGRGVTHYGDSLDDRSRGDLAEGDGVEKLAAGHPVVVVDRVGPHQRDDHEPAAVGQCADLERHPGDRGEHADADRPGGESLRGNEHRHESGCLTASADGQFDDATAEQNQHQPRADQRGRRDSGCQVSDPARPVGGPAPARRDQPAAGVHGDGRHRGARSGSGAAHPGRRGAGEEQRGQREDDDQAGHDERDSAEQRADPAADLPGAEDRQLGGGRAGQQIARGDGVFELALGQPFPALHTQLAQQRDMRGWPAEADAADPAPLPQYRRQARQCRVFLLSGLRGPSIGVRHRAAGWNSSTGLPDGSSNTICCPPGPVTMSLRNSTPASRSRATSAAMSSTIR